MENPTIPQQDFYRASGRWLSVFQIWKECFSPNLHFVYLFRIVQRHPKSTLAGKFWRLVLRRYQIKYGFQIYPETRIGPGFYLGHWGAVVINPQAVIGKNCNIAQGVTIGQSNRGKSMGVPTIGNEVWIGANAVIVGGIIIGDDVLISPNAFVTTDVPSHSVVTGNPAQIMSRQNATEGYISHKI